MTARTDFRALLTDTVLRCIMSPDYFFHVPATEEMFAYPLFSLEKKVFDQSSENARLIDEAMHALEFFSVPVTREMLAHAFGRSSGTNGATRQVFIEQRCYKIPGAADCAAFFSREPLPLQSQYGVVAAETGGEVLVLGSMVPRDYSSRLLAAPEESYKRFRDATRMLPYDETLLACLACRAAGFTVMTSMTHLRHLTNVFERVLMLMERARHILLMLAPGSASLAIEYGAICGRPDLAPKCVVLVEEGDHAFTTLGKRGAFKLSAPFHIVYERSQLPDYVEQAIALFKERDGGGRML